MNKFISYEGLPLNSGGAHSLGRKNPKAYYDEIMHFLKMFSSTPQPKLIELSLYAPKKREYSVLKLLAKLSLKFGIPKMRNDGLVRAWNWNLHKKNTENALEILALNKDLSDTPSGPLYLNIKWNFHFKDPKTHQTLAHQERIPEFDFRIKNSQIYLRLSKKSTASVWFALPFEQIDPYALEYIKAITSNLPFKTSDNHWKIWHKSEKGNWIPRKLELL